MNSLISGRNSVLSFDVRSELTENVSTGTPLRESDR